MHYSLYKVQKLLVNVSLNRFVDVDLSDNVSIEI